MVNAQYQLYHSAEGSTWTKKDHKYIRKEGNKYIYADDSKGSHELKQLSQQRANRSAAANGVKELYRMDNGSYVREYGRSDQEFAKDNGKYATTKMRQEKAANKVANGQTTNINDGRVVSNGKTMTPSEYIAQQRKENPSINKDGTYRSNSEEARNNGKTTKKDSRAIRKEQAKSQKKGLQINIPDQVHQLRSDSVMRKYGSTGSNFTSTMRGAKPAAREQRSSGSFKGHGMSMDQFNQSRLKGSTTRDISQMASSVGTTEQQVSAGMQAVEEMLRRGGLK